MDLYNEEEQCVDWAEISLGNWSGKILELKKGNSFFLFRTLSSYQNFVGILAWITQPHLLIIMCRENLFPCRTPIRFSSVAKAKKGHVFTCFSRRLFFATAKTLLQAKGKGHIEHAVYKHREKLLEKVYTWWKRPSADQTLSFLVGCFSNVFSSMDTVGIARTELINGQNKPYLRTWAWLLSFFGGKVVCLCCETLGSNEFNFQCQQPAMHFMQKKWTNIAAILTALSSIPGVL